MNWPVTTTADWPALSAALTDALHLGTAPIGITFHAEMPESLPAFQDPMPAVSPDGRTGRVPAGCVFWMKSAGGEGYPGRTFTTVAADHANCSVGSWTHGFISLEEAAGKGDVGALLDSGWVTMEMIPGIPTVTEKPAAITYGPVGQTEVVPDVILIRLNPKQAMVLYDAIPGMRIEGKPQCHIVAAAKEQNEVVASVGCMLSRVRTAMPSTEMTCAIPAGKLADVVEAVARTAATDAIVAGYAAEDARRFV